jgi:hypothetical protein
MGFKCSSTIDDVVVVVVASWSSSSSAAAVVAAVTETQPISPPLLRVASHKLSLRAKSSKLTIVVVVVVVVEAAAAAAAQSPAPVPPVLRNKCKLACAISCVANKMCCIRTATRCCRPAPVAIICRLSTVDPRAVGYGGGAFVDAVLVDDEADDDDAGVLDDDVDDDDDTTVVDTTTGGSFIVDMKRAFVDTTRPVEDDDTIGCRGRHSFSALSFRSAPPPAVKNE